MLTWVCAAENSLRAEALRQQAEAVEGEADDAGDEPGHGEPDRQSDEPAPDEPRPAEHEPGACRGHGQQVGADRHGADDQGRAVVDDGRCGDDARGGHQHEVARGRARLQLSLPEHVGPDEGRGLAAAGLERDRVEPDERDVARRHTERLERRERRVGSVGANVRRDERRPSASASTRLTCRAPASASSRSATAVISADSP